MVWLRTQFIYDKMCYSHVKSPVWCSIARQRMGLASSVDFFKKNSYFPFAFRVRRIFGIWVREFVSQSSTKHKVRNGICPTVGYDVLRIALTGLFQITLCSWLLLNDQAHWLLSTTNTWPSVWVMTGFDWLKPSVFVNQPYRGSSSPTLTSTTQVNPRDSRPRTP